MDNESAIEDLQTMAEEGNTPAEMLRYLVLELKIEQQIEVMKIFSDAMNATLGEVTAISAWWHDDTAELNDSDINAYMSPLVEEYLEDR